jgi:hypothetical protein
MKFNKDQVQKAALVGMVAVGCLYYYCAQLLGPLSLRATRAASETADLEKKISAAKPKIAHAAAIEAGDPNAPAARQAYAAMTAHIPTGEPIAWFPTRLTEFFRKEGIPKQNFRCNPDLALQQFPGFKTSCWMIELPGVDFATLGKALAALENQEGLIQIVNLQIEASSKEPDRHHAQLVVTTLVKSDK